MGKNHLKRLAVPWAWNIKRKENKYVVRPRGYLESALPVAVILKEILGVAKTRSEVKKILQDGKVTVDAKVIRDDKLPVGLMSVINIEHVGQFRILLDNHGKLFLKKLDSKESMIKLCKVISKTTLKGNKTQLGLHDGRTLLSDNKACKPNDTLVFELPGFKTKDCLKLEKNSKVYLTGGSNVGSTGTVENISDSVTIKIDDNVIETAKDNVFVIGTTKELISVKD